ncbi:MAG: hypothetical protein M1383_04805 [Patescibacteria group bacterium]|nr:hypothetical protein [Patescibacteria group bacterium]
MKTTILKLGRISGITLVAVLLAWPFGFVKADGPYLTLSSFSGTPQTIQASGGGWTPGETISIYLGSAVGSPVATAKAGADSFFGPVGITIPANTPQGALPIIGVGSSGGQTASNSFYVTNFYPGINIISSNNTPGSSVTVDGSGFAPAETVTFTLGGQTVGTISAGDSGSFTGFSFIVPNLAPDTYQLHAIGSLSGAEAIAYFYIGGFYPSAAPSVYYLMPGGTLSFSGNNFSPNETVDVSAGNNPDPVSTIIVSSAGDFANAGSYEIPASAIGGIMTFHLKSSKTGTDIPIMVTIGQFNALVSPDNYFLVPGQAIKFYGQGFAPNEKVDVFQNQDSAAVAVIAADKGGGFADAGNLIIPFSDAGRDVTFRFVGQQSNTASAFTVSVGSFNPQITPSEYYLIPGKSFTVWGTGFAPEEEVSVQAGGESDVVVTDKYGVFQTSGPFAAPYSGSDNIRVKAAGLNSGVSADLDIGIGGLYPNIVPDNYYILSGGKINFSGYGFAPNENVTMSDGQDALAVIPTDEYGNFTGQAVTAPFGPDRNVTYKFTGDKSGASAGADIAIAALRPLVSLDSYYATPGSTIYVWGINFSPGETVTVTAGSSTAASLVDKNGVASTTPIVLPFNNSSNTLDVVMTGNTSKASGFAALSLAPFLAQVYPSTYYTAPGTVITFSGSGYAKNEKVNVNFNNSPLGFVNADANGGFNTTKITIPVTASGSANFAFVGAQSNASSSVDIALAPFMPQVSPSAYYTVPGTPVTFTGSGFAPGEEVKIFLNNSPAAAVTADAEGNIASGPVTIPFTAATANFTFSSSVTNYNTVLDIGVGQLNPGIVLSGYYGFGGQPLSINGQGFGGNEKVDITFAGEALGSANTDAAGNFTLNTAVPYAAAGDKAVKAIGESSGAQASATFTEPQAYVNVQLGSYAGAPGSAINFIGSGFLPNEPVEITTDRTGSAAVHTIVADAKGSFNDSGYVVPPNFAEGNLNLAITGTYSKSVTDIVYYVAGK